ncbi:Peptidyl-prolyl cis-trans isomerase A precursor [Polystyrenella longa]|uniref:peptidylprolyl isomerase n=1 Tax=Polystyrenella longa TaxID=2528007 RepID=A0A518CIK3_9PLAN|nr:peptidylprolyl isomerase [Polystyrenella longa]QDU79059.1 Peptidyl-prolyl cis-trans isomerase A precursor [Polystyrenella longa]
MFLSVWLPFISPRKSRLGTQRRSQQLYRNAPSIGTVEHLEDRTLLTNFFGLEGGFLADVYDHISTVERGNETTEQQASHQSLIETASGLTGFSHSEVGSVLDDLEKYYSKIEARYGDVLRTIFGERPDDDDGSSESPENTAPEAIDISDQVVTIQTDFSLDTSTAFEDADEDDTLTFEVTWDDAPTLPNWANFDTDTGILSGTPGTADLGQFTVGVTATDEAGESASTSFSLTVQVSPNVVIGDATYNEEDGAGNMTFDVSLDSAASERITLTLSTVDGTAVAGSDYTSTTTQVTFEAGEVSKTFSVPVLSDDVPELSESFTVVVDSVDEGTVADSSDTGTGTITNDDPVALSIEVDDDSVIESNNILVTNKPTVTIRGNTQPGSTVTVAKDNDGVFNDGTTNADADGNFQLEVPLSHTDANLGVNNLFVRSTLGEVSKTESLDIHYSIGTVVRIESNLGDFDIELLDDDAPKSVENFKSYFAAYAGSTIHRAIDGFIIQGGGFDFDATTQGLVSIPTNDPVENEFIAKNSNVRGTLSTALQSGNIDSFSSGWFINTVDNLFLDNVPHTVFGRVIGDGMDVVDAISNADSINLNGVYDGTAFATVPLVNYTPFTDSIDGLVSIVAGSTTLTGVNTQFLTQLQNSFGSIPGSAIRIAGEEFVVASVVSDTELRLNQAHTAGATNVEADIHALPSEENLVLISQFDILLASAANQA